MLVLSRYVNGEIYLEDEHSQEVVAKITVVEVRDKKVRLGFDAEKHINIRRAEVPSRLENI